MILCSKLAWLLGSPGEICATSASTNQYLQSTAGCSYAPF